MSKEPGERAGYPIWINHVDKIVSFKSEEGFEQLHFSSHEEKLAFAIDKCSSGYRIQIRRYQIEALYQGKSFFLG